MRIRIAEVPGNVRIKVVGVGGSGGNAVSRMAGKLDDVALAAVNTDFQALSVINSPIKFMIGRETTGGQGTGGNPELGKFAAEEDRVQLGELFKGSRIVFLVMGVGGGTGTGAGPVMAEIARNAGALVIGFVNLPFSSLDGPIKLEVARKGIEELRKYTDTLVTISNDRIFEVVPPGTSLSGAFEKIDEIIYHGVSGISNLLTKPAGQVNLDFADLRTIIRQGGEGLIGVGIARGEGRAREAAQTAVGNPFLKREALFSARHILVSLTYGNSLTPFEISQVMDTVKAAFPVKAKVFTGVATDPRLQDDLKVMVIATGLEDMPTAAPPLELFAPQPQPRPRKKPAAGSVADSRQPLLFGNEGGLPAYLKNKLNKN